MIYTQTLVLPTEDTISKLKEIMNYSPFEIKWETLFVELNLCPANEVVSVAPNRVFTATPINSNPDITSTSLITAYNVETESTSLYLSLTSPELYQCAVDLRAKNGTVFHPVPLIYMNLVPVYHSSLLHNRFVNSITESFTTNMPVFTFDAMMTRDIDLNKPNDSGYYDVNGLV